MGILIIFILSISVYYDSSANLNDNNPLYQVSTLNSLSEGNYDEKISSGNLKYYGDTGMGTFTGLDGEMIELNGNIYQIKSDGNVYLVNNSAGIPYATVTFFKADKVIITNKSMNYTELQQYLNSTLPSKNLVYSFKVIGKFDSVKARSPPKQDKPYQNLTEALKNQSIFNFNDINGTMVGFWFPRSASSINLNDYHFHFINEDRNSGGHVLDCKLENAIIEIDYISNVYIMYPQSNEFTKFNLAAS
ncbi:acetolactate decarboxylase [Methanobacterium oryzae]